MNIVETIRYMNLRRKRKSITRLSKEDENLIVDRIMNHNEYELWFLDTNIRAKTSKICEAAYLVQTTEKGIKQVCHLTPAKAVRDISNVDFLQYLIEDDYMNFDFINMDNLSQNADKYAVAKCATTFIKEMDKAITSCKETGNKEISNLEFRKAETISLYNEDLKSYDKYCKSDSVSYML